MTASLNNPLTADLSAIAGVSGHVEHVGHTLSHREEPVDASLHCPAVPEAADFLRALSSARHAHSLCLGSLSSFFADATSALNGFSSTLDGHERSTSAAWERWRP